MQAQVEEFAHEWNQGDRAVAKEIARSYFAERPQVAEMLGGKTIEQLVSMVDAYRAEGREEDRIMVDMYLQAQFEPQNIIGSFSIGGQSRNGRS